MTALITRRLGMQDYQKTLSSMQTFNAGRSPQTKDEIWVLEHPQVFTLGLNGKAEHILDAGDIPVIQSDRGGQVTYHGPGQLVVYTLLDINRLKLGVRPLVSLLEQAVIDALGQYGLKTHARPEAPGIYIGPKKIASIGLRIRRGCCYHGISINNQMDLSPFQRINTCGYPDLEVTQLAEQGVFVHNYELAVPVVNAIINRLPA